MMLRAIVYLIAALSAASAVAADLSGVAEVIDGDTIAIRGQPTRIRLWGIDTPEGRQTCRDRAGRRYLCGSRAADALADLIGRNGRVTCEPKDRDRYGRIVAICRTRGRDLNAEMVRQGWAVEYTQYSDGRYSALEAEARIERRGLWSGTFVKPWDWRRGERLSMQRR
jgi:endonuclease YncB( thermonuclease family)